MSCNLKRVIIIFILSIYTFSFYGLEKPDFNIIKKSSSFDFLNTFNKSNFINLSNYNEDNIIDKKSLYTYTGFQSNLYRSGLYMLCFGGASAILGGALFGLSYLLNWYCAQSIGWSYESVVFNVFFLESVFNIQSYYAAVAVAFWISGIVLMALSVMIIPGIILMAIDAGSTARRLNPLKDAIGFKINF